jgi:hypothetical protein
MSRFSNIPFDDESKTLAEGAQGLCDALEKFIGGVAPIKGRAAATALTKLEECHMWIGKAIRDAQLSRKAEAPLEVS